MSQDVKTLQDEGSRRQVIVAGAVAGLVSRFVIAPLDVIKIRLQLQTHSLSDPLSHRGVLGPVYKGTWRTFRSILHNEGVLAFWKGNVPAELLYLTYGAVQFSTYSTVSRTLSHPTTPDGSPLLPGALAHFIAGATAGSVATTLTYPLDLLRTRFAAQGSERVYDSLLASVRDIRRHEGYRGFFRGLSAGVAQIVPYMGLFFTLYEGFKPPMASLSARAHDLTVDLWVGHHAEHAEKPDWSGAGEFAAGTLASVLSKTAVFPLDTVRKRLQVQGPMRGRYIHRNIPEYRGGVLRTVRAIVDREGPRGLYRGLVVGLIKSAPAGAVTVWTYERAMAIMFMMEGDKGPDG